MPVRLAMWLVVLLLVGDRLPAAEWEMPAPARIPAPTRIPAPARMPASSWPQTLPGGPSGGTSPGPRAPADPRAPAGPRPPAGPRAPAGQVRPFTHPGLGPEVPSPGAVANRPETLQEAWAIALAVSRPLEAGRWEVSSARHTLESARAQRWPKASMETSYTVRDHEPAFRFDFPGLPLATDTFPFAQDEDFAFRAKLDLPLYTSGRIRSGIDAADAEVTSAEWEVARLAMDLKLQVAEDYVAVLRAQRELELTQSTERSLEAHLRDVDLLFKHDQVPINDLLAAQVAWSNARQSTIQAENRLDVGRAAYNRRLGRPLIFPVRIAELQAEPVAEDVETLTARALRMRPEPARLREQARALEHRARSVRARDLPQLALRGEYLFEENRFRSPEGIAGAGLGLSWNVFDAGVNRHQAAALQARQEGLLRLQADVESIIALQLRRAWLDVQETRRRLEVTREAIRRAEENLRVARQRYRVGVGTNTEVLDAEKLRTEAYRNHDNATYDAVLAVLRLRHASGELRP
jgi:outer membrane protein